MKKNDIVITKQPEEWLDVQRLFTVILYDEGINEGYDIIVETDDGNFFRDKGEDYRLATEEEKLEHRLRTIFEK